MPSETPLVYQRTKIYYYCDTHRRSKGLLGFWCAPKLAYSPPREIIVWTTHGVLKPPRECTMYVFRFGCAQARSLAPPMLQV